MKKLRKLMTLTFAVALTFVLGFGNALAAVPNKVTVQRAEILKDYAANHPYGFTIFTTTDGKIMYCIDPDKKALSHGQTVTYDKDGDAGLLYILQNGYPNKAITGTSEDAQKANKYITQAAVWWYMDETGQAGAFSEAFKNASQNTDVYQFIPKYIKPLVENAKKAKDTSVKPSMQVSGNAGMSLTSDKKYYESNYMSATLTGAKTYNVKLTGATKNTEVVDEQGNIGTTMNSGEKFKVRVPANEGKKGLNITVKLSADASITKARIYKPSDDKQRVVGIYDENVELTKEIKLSSDGKHICEFTDNKYYGKNGTVVDKETYDKECGQEVVVPNTSANIILWTVALGVLAIIAGIGTILYRSKKNPIK